MAQTPEQCFLDMLENARELLVEYCGYEVPIPRDSMSFFKEGPSFIFHYHPALGPLYEIIQQKLQGGKLAPGSELQLEIADFYGENLNLEGSLQIATDAVMGHLDTEGILTYSNRTGKCILKNVTVQNKGVDFEVTRSFWKEEIIHRQKCEIFIEDGGEFVAENLTLSGDIRIFVPAGVKVTAKEVDGKIELFHQILSQPSWQWTYSVNENNEIILQK